MLDTLDCAVSSTIDTLPPVIGHRSQSTSSGQLDFGCFSARTPHVGPRRVALGAWPSARVES